MTSAVRRARSFVATIPVFGVVAVLGYLTVMALGALPVAHQARPSGFVDTTSQLFGFGVIFQDRPFLTFFAIVITIHAAARACGLFDPSILVTRLAPILAIAFSLIFYSHGLANLGKTVLLIVALLIWSAALFTANRFVITFVGVDANMILATTSVAIFLAEMIVHGQARAYLLVVIGILAAVAGPTVPVSIGSSEYTRGTFRHADDRARIRIVLDPAVTSGLAAFVVIAVVIRIHGTAATAGFVVAQLAALALIAIRRLSTDRIKGMLARRQIGTPLTDSELRSYLRGALARSMVIAAVALSGAAAFSASASEGTTSAFLLEEWAGVILLTGVVSIGSALSVAGATVPPLPPSDHDTSMLVRLREQLRAWRRMRFAWVWKVVLLSVVIFGLLRWISDWVGVVDVSGSIWRMVENLFK